VELNIGSDSLLKKEVVHEIMGLEEPTLKLMEHYEILWDEVTTIKYNGGTKGTKL